ncbi:MAG: cupredoxin domain-containing protein [Actinobacteria bacterium]|nr:cupredoxin domain-containing protein [Actinomycetota bacterium]
MRHKTHKALPAATLLAIMTLFAAACGGGGGDSDSDNDDGGSSADPVTSLSVVGNEFSFEPGDFTIAAGQEVTVTYRNDGAVDHSFTILEEGTVISKLEDYNEDMEIPDTHIHLEPGETGSATFTISKPGRYQFICELPGHLEAGMKGQLTVS